MSENVYAIFINAVSGFIEIVQLSENQLQSAYQLIGCDLIEAAARFPNGDVLYVDEEGLLKSTKGEFSFRGHVFKGNGLIVNESDERWTTPKSFLSQVFNDIILH